jgi:hypothetical protein
MEIMASELFFKRDDLSTWMDGNLELIRGFEQLVANLKGVITVADEATIAAQEAQETAEGAYPISGSNANGRYTKFPDRTLHCTVMLSLGTAAQTWTFPFEPLTVDFVGGSIVDSTAALAFVKFDAPGATSVITRGYEFSGGTMINSVRNRNVEMWGTW